uniref:NADH-ubiquinone oxidoreductase chain 6 n=1 Tax=Megabeleses liriodendrovorax TaxID=2735432 RepID=A0A8F0WJ31_9HYME|nr:NADH dehydrogenase subunit 6 [Megabeleses liriodendrovorax]QWM93821.1 NADH dehydrogenase subunit 6 [Megabeleses liriodendrovorax]
MMKMFLLSIMLMNSMLLLLINNPFSFGLILLLQTLMITLISGMLSMSFWYSYILFLTMIGGLLILFIYMSSLTSNQKFYFNNKIFSMYMITLTLLFFMFMLYKFLLNLNYDIMSSFIYNENENNFYLKMSLNKLYNTPTNQIMVILINYLLLNMFIVVKITNVNMGPLRTNF